MFNLIPWKKRSHGDNIAVRRAEPSRQELDYYPLDRFRDEFDALVNRFFDDRAFGLFGAEMPRLWPSLGPDWDMNVGWKDEGNEFTLHLELPGYEPEDIDINVSGRTLTVRAEREDEENANGSRGYRYGSFARAFTLPHGVDEAKIDARYHSGVLEVHLPKTEQARGRQIPISAN